MKKLFTVTLFIGLIMLVACSNEEPTPGDAFTSYVEHWNENEQEALYDMFSEATKDTFTKEESIERNESIYQDLNIEEFVVTFEGLSEEATEKALEEEQVTIPFQAEMNSIAGPISFTYEATLLYEGEEDEKEWVLEWDPGFIFPELVDGGEISLSRTTPVRGEILDKNQMPLAMNGQIYEVGVVPEKLEGNSKDRIADIIGISVESIDQALDAGWVEPDLLVPLKRIHDEDLLETLWDIPGVMTTEKEGRIYPSGEATAHLIGNVGSITAEELEESTPGVYQSNDVIGKRGLESLYEEQLRGTNGIRILVKKENEDDVVLAEQEVQNGENISLTIDVNVQEKLFESFDGDSGTGVALHPETGETIAIVSSPAYDPNEILYGTTPNLWSQLQENEENPLLNRFSATFAPGSVMKALSAGIGLEDGSIVPEDGISIDGLTWSNGESWGDYEVRRVSESSGPVDIEDAMIRSDNIYFAMKAVEMGEDAFIEGLNAYGFTEDFPYEYPITSSTISTDGQLASELLLANASYGQGELEMSALHLASAYSTFINEGNMIKPILLTSEDTNQFWKENVLSPENANVVHESLVKVVSEGTAAYARTADFPIAGKTGTAELKLTLDDEDGKENGWFVAYPADSQDIVVAMMVESVQGRGGSGYTVEKVTDFLIDYKN